MCADHIPSCLLSSLTPAQPKTVVTQVILTRQAPPTNYGIIRSNGASSHTLQINLDLAFLQDVKDTCVHKEDGEVAEPKEMFSETVIPEEFHIIQNRGVVGLRLKDEKYTTYLEDDEKNMRIFPSMRPMVRSEVVELTHVLDTWLEKLRPMTAETQGPTPMHSLLQLVQQEQCVYNAVFHEVIRQVSVQCAERGQLLAKLRERYSALLSRVPELVAEMHGDVLATRAQHRRLMEQLVAFQTSIKQMASELSCVYEQDCRVSAQAQREREELNRALDESRRNANLLEEYHSVYGLHRHRLESSMGILQRERDGWASAALALASKLAEERSIVTVHRLRGHSHAWANAAQQHLLLLSNRGGSVVVEVRSLANSWAETAALLDRACLRAEEGTAAKLEQTHIGLKRWATRIIITQDGENGLGFPEMNLMKELQADLQCWAQSLADDLERFGGAGMLELMEELASLKSLSARLTALSQILRHEHQHGHVTACQIEYDGVKHNAGNERPQEREVRDINGRQSSNKDQLIGGGAGSDGDIAAEAGDGWQHVTARIESSVLILHARVTGENGLADMLKDLCRAFDTWSEKLALASSTPHVLPASDWLQLGKFLSDWSLVVTKALVLVDKSPSEEKKESEAMDAVVDALQGWVGRLATAVEREASRLAEQLGMVREGVSSWLVGAVLHITSPQSPPAHHREDGGGASDRCTDLVKTRSSLGDAMLNITRHIVTCCEAVAESDGSNREDMALRDLEAEYSEWMEVSQLLLLELSSRSIAPVDIAQDEGKCSDFNTQKGDLTVQVIGHDANVETRSLSKEMSSLALGHEPQTYDAMDTLKQLQAQILSTEERAQLAEERVAQLQEELRLATVNREERDLCKDGLGGNELRGQGREPPPMDEVVPTSATASSDGTKLGIPEQRHSLLEKPRSAGRLRKPSKSPRTGRK